jgi:3-oxoacyl-[acyl-carrier protein] reductase
VHYSAAKAGVIGLSKALAKEVGPSGITVNCICPGLIDTEMNGSLDEETVKSIEEETPLCRMGRPEEVAQACFFFASEKASFITGQVVGVNGGLVIT